MTAQRTEQVKQRPRVALVTGGAVRVGRVIAVTFAREGFDVAISYHRSERAARVTLRELTACGVAATAVRADLGSPAEAKNLVGQVVRRLGALDVLVNSAALFYRTPFVTTTPAQYDRLLNLNLRGVFFCAQAAARIMPAGGRIINIGDVGGARAWPGYIPYTLSKAGVASLTRSLAAALRPRISVNCVAPGPVLRPVRIPRARWRRLTRGLAGRPQDVAAAAVFFATCPGSITGQVLTVDGGASL
jgi:NAD(P)-dependent dehydrogenase (short-subunit alcohol dehydrogenase family)